MGTGLDDCCICGQCGHLITLCGLQSTPLCAKHLMDLNRWYVGAPEHITYGVAAGQWELLVASLIGGRGASGDLKQAAEAYDEATRTMARAIHNWVENHPDRKPKPEVHGQGEAILGEAGEDIRPGDPVYWGANGKLYKYQIGKRVTGENE